MNTISIKDRDVILNISYEDMIKYHGRFYIGGVAMAYKALELAFAKLPHLGIPSREKITFATAMGMEGMGVIDGVEMVTRARSREKLIADIGIIPKIPAPDAPNGGKYYFELNYDRTMIAIAVKEGLIPEEFIILSGKALSNTISEEEAIRIQIVKEDLASLIMTNAAEDLFNWSLCESR
ncbi:MAG: hypothetical protein PHP26_03905 [Syntrophomonas sp.]|uniref:hypothetical protein n=1 Tax=Syntrophomonas sp. TaxID=2053627 RepID=UPI002631F0AA|nr:hypothetical protein [Syntrophomonas sp.]MDD2510396.1 hypothetical protein [Syntrophomonas sp.]MDD3879120.1 hypothetical protein [Syntrophomonas sp.]MDD4625566.1 hypothetical protein [Syntrophomonas sp.]